MLFLGRDYWESFFVGCWRANHRFDLRFWERFGNRVVAELGWVVGCGFGGRWAGAKSIGEMPPRRHTVEDHAQPCQWVPLMTTGSTKLLTPIPDRGAAVVSRHSQGTNGLDADPGHGN